MQPICITSDKSSTAPPPSPKQSHQTPVKKMEKIGQPMAIALVVMVVLISTATTNVNAIAVHQKHISCKLGDGIIDCLPCITGTSSPPPEPSKVCCAALNHTDIACVCSKKDDERLRAFGVKPELARKLPAKCNLTLPEGCTKVFI